VLGLIILGSFIAMILIAFKAVIEPKLAHSIVLSMGIGLSAIILFVVFQAPDVALTQAVIGVGISSLVFLMGLKHLKGSYES
jgi:multicomponent Na+:H+ antiporter subunit B